MITKDDPGAGGPIAQSGYLIERFRVVFESGGGWHCACHEFVAANACRHTREAAGMRDAQAQIAQAIASGKSTLR
jgi:hypothetical protein